EVIDGFLRGRFCKLATCDSKIACQADSLQERTIARRKNYVSAKVYHAAEWRFRRADQEPKHILNASVAHRKNKRSGFALFSWPVRYFASSDDGCSPERSVNALELHVTVRSVHKCMKLRL